ncbi:Hydrogen peroxide-inducible genes activator [Rubripirellula obstinata]|uniref:Hydrogen peroxide-inducible genes activator n=2 Tax=Rubripirellula obstinata TaxID=406547 RepID=A0A5B1CLI8_9BACT|nr:Hydrogen peroxide-inducible genes activator [Rubripirellula obstinata]
MAAESVGMSQPAISRSIARLEEDFGQPLLERGTRQVTLTDAGILLRSRAQQVLSILEDAKAEINDDGETGRIRVGAIPTIAPYLLPSLLKKFATRFPAAHVGVEEDTTEHLSKRLTHGEIDIAIMALPISEKYLQVETLFEEELLLVMPADHALAEKKQIRASDIETLPFVLLGEAHCLSDSVVTFCRSRSFQPVALERTSQLATVQELVALGHGVSMIPAMARKLDKSKSRSYRSLAGTKPTRTIVACWNPYRFQSKLLESFREILRSTTP